MTQKKTKRAEVAETILSRAEGQIVSVTFVKRDNTVRVLNGRAGVRKGVNGKGMAYAPKERGLYPLFDMQKEAFRMANLNTASEIKVGGVRFAYDPAKGWVGSDGTVMGAEEPAPPAPPRTIYDFDPKVGF